LGLERSERRLREAAASRRLRDVVPEGLFQLPGRIRRKPRRNAMPVDMQQRGHLFTVPSLAARNQIQGVQPLLFLFVS
jgi:hypothetical protein